MNISPDGYTTVCGNPENPDTWLYIRNDNGIYVRGVEIDSGKGGEEVKILQFTDVHFNYVNEKDFDNEEVMGTIRHRFWNAGGASVIAVKKVMEYAKNFDQTVVTGDVLDYLTHGAMELMEKYIWDKDPEIMISLGSHDLTRQMQTGIKDKTSLESRYKIIENFWRHDVYYTSKILKDKVMIIQLDNNQHHYRDCQVSKLEADLEIARKNGYVVLIFQHDPLCTGYPEDAVKKALWAGEGAGDTRNYYDEAVGYNPEDEATKKIYGMLTGNADIIKGFFCGHRHGCYYMEVKGSYTDENGNVIEKNIPQYVLEAVVYDDYAGHVTEITIK